MQSVTVVTRQRTKKTVINRALVPLSEGMFWVLSCRCPARPAFRPKRRFARSASKCARDATHWLCGRRAPRQFADDLVRRPGTQPFMEQAQQIDQLALTPSRYRQHQLERLAAPQVDADVVRHQGA